MAWRGEFFFFSLESADVPPAHQPQEIYPSSPLAGWSLNSKLAHFFDGSPGFMTTLIGLNVYQGSALRCNINDAANGPPLLLLPLERRDPPV